MKKKARKLNTNTQDIMHRNYSNYKGLRYINKQQQKKLTKILFTLCSLDYGIHPTDS